MYQEGHTYIYRLEGKSVTSVTDSQGDATLNLKAIVELTAKPDCVLQLQLKDVHLNDAVSVLQIFNDTICLNNKIYLFIYSHFKTQNIQSTYNYIFQPAPLSDIQKYALQFSYHHGHIDPDVCAEPDDSQASLNIKRAVASLFQSAVQLEYGSTVHHEVHTNLYQLIYSIFVHSFTYTL